MNKCFLCEEILQDEDEIKLGICDDCNYCESLETSSNLGDD